MPTYQITAPNGKTYRIEGPAGASDEQIRAEVLRQFPDADPTFKQHPETVRGPDIVDPPEPTGMDTIAKGLQQARSSENSALASVVEGAVAAPYDMLANAASGVNQAVNYGITEGGGAVLNALGAGGAADSLRGAGRQSRNALAQMGGTATEAIERISPTPEGMGAARFTGQLAGGLMVPFGPKRPPGPVRAPTQAPANQAEQLVRDGAANKTRVMTSDVRPPKSFTGKNLRAFGERIPVAGTGGPRVKQHEERVEAVKNLAREFGIESSEEVLEEVADDLAKTRGGRIANLVARKKRVIEGIKRPFTEAPKAVAAIDEQIARLNGIDDVEYKPVVDRLIRFREQLTSGKSLDQVEGQRKLLGDMFADQNLAGIKGDGQKAINAIYSPLRDDMGTFIKRNSGDEALTAWKKSNDELSAMAGELDASAFKRVLKDTDTTPENVAKLLFSKKPSDVRRLYGNLSPTGQEKAKAAVLHEAISRGGGLEDISPQKFATALGAFGKTTGIIFGDDAPRIEGIVRLLKATQQASVAAAAPPTGVQNSQAAYGYIAGSLFGAGAITVGGVAGAAARLYESAPVRNLLISLSKTPPGSKAEGALLQRIGKTLAAQAEIQAGRAASNDNVRFPTEIAADPERD